VSRSRWLQWGVRLLCLAAAVLFALGGPIPYIVSRMVPGVSPLVVFANSLAGRQWYAGLFWGLPAIVVLVIAVWRGRFFCRWICPAGTLHSAAALCGGRKRPVRFRCDGIFFWMTVAGACVGFPLWLFMDPLSSFARLVPLIKGTCTGAALVPGLLLPLFLLLGALQPLVWCSHFCPLGYLFEFCHVRAAHPVWKQDRMRRDFIAGLLLGAPLALTARAWAPMGEDPPLPPPILPPGAGDPGRFASLCTRCYACVEACPTRVIKVRSPLGRILGRFFHPELDTNRSYCEESCTQCSQVCPSGAIRPLSEDAKRRLQIGRARVKRKACLSWEDGEECMLCEEACPYAAIMSDRALDGLDRPVVDSELCCGCGACQAECPATRLGKAIIVTGVERQGEVISDLQRA
jgi:ferredoxin-type protein NapF